jgi:uncharacterized linocin/CFP29 family protein
LNHLLRSLAPISDAGWEELDTEASRQLKVSLAARKLVDFSGPHGWSYSCSNLGRTDRLGGSPTDGVSAAVRRVLPLVELRSDFSLSRQELADVDRGALDIDLDDLAQAARRIGLAENRAVFHGFEEGGITGIVQSSSHEPVPLGASFDSYPRDVAKAVELLLRCGVGGPYGLALGPDGYTGVIETTEHGGYPLFDHLRHILGGPIVWAPGVRGAIVVSLRGGDFLFASGQDLSLGYDRHDAERVHLYFEESFSFRVVTNEASVPMTPPGV